MKNRYIVKDSNKVGIFARLIAKGIDLFIVIILSFFFYPLGVLLGAVYLSISDALQGGQSVGKKLLGFGVIALEDKKPCSLKQSFVRNLPLLIPTILAIIPLWGIIFSSLVGIPLILLETYLIFTLKSGMRIGDVMADTTVITPGEEGAKKQRESFLISGKRQATS